MKILVTEPEYFDDKAIRMLSRQGTVVAKRLTYKELSNIISEVDAILVRIETYLDRAMLRRAKKLRVIGSATTGLNHIDVKYALEHGIEVISLHGTHTVPTAEHTLALMLSLCRKIPWAHAALLRGEWQRYRFIGTQLSGKTLGIIGFGRIGSQVAKYAESLGMHVIFYDPYVKPKSGKAISVPLRRLLAGSDIITIHAALTKETRNMISAAEFRAMKRSALLVNTARGEIVDQEALISALANHKIAGAAEDVFPKEPMEGRGRLQAYAKTHGNLIITPHISASADDAVHAAGVEIAGKVCKVLSHQKKGKA